MKLYYLYNKNRKKARSLKELIDEPDGVVELTNNFIEGDGVALNRACGTRWIAKKSKNKGRNQQMARLLKPSWDGILFAPADAIKRTLVGLAEIADRKGNKRSCYVEKNL